MMSAIYVRHPSQNVKFNTVRILIGLQIVLYLGSAYSQKL